MDFDGILVKESPGLCRCCLSEGCYKDLGSEYTWMDETEVYADMLLECFDISISQHIEGPNGPNRLICEVCITRLRDACNFKKQVLESEKKFVDMVGRGEFKSKVIEYREDMKLEMVLEPQGVEETEVEYLDEDIDYDDGNKDDSNEPSVSEDITVDTLQIKGKRGRPKKSAVKPEKKKKLEEKAKPKIVKEEKIDKFCFLMSKCEKKGWIVETKNVYKFNNKRKLVPIRLDESYDTPVYVRNVGVPLNDLLVVGSDDDPKALRDRHVDGIKRIRTLKINKYSRTIQHKTTATALTENDSTRGTAKEDAAHISEGYYRNTLPREKSKSSEHPEKRINSLGYESFEDPVDPKDTEDPENIDNPEDQQYDVDIKIEGEKDVLKDDGDLEVDGEKDLHDLPQDDGDLEVDDSEDPQDDGEEIEIEGEDDSLLMYHYCCSGEVDADGSSRDNHNINSSLSGKSCYRDTRRRVLGVSNNSLASKLNLRNRRLKNINSNRATKRLQRNFVNSRRPGKLEAKVNSLVKKFVEDSPKRPSNEENLILPVPNFEESIVKDGTKEFLVIDGLRIDTDHLSDILKQNTMRKRANHIMREMWPPDVMGRMFLRRQTTIDIQTLTTSEDRRKLRNVCLHFQKRKEIKYCAGSKDDIDVYIKEWMSAIFRECRRKIRRQVTD